MKKLLLILSLFIPLVASAYVSEKTKRITVGSSFSISPWSERGSTFSSGYTCCSTYITTSDASAFSINETSRSSTSYVSSGSIQHGFYATYRIEANKTGTYILYAGSTCIKSTAGGYEHGNPVVKYTIVVSSSVSVTGISLNTSESEITIGENLQLQASIQPSNATNKMVTWSSSDETVAKVDDQGTVTGVGLGSCEITVKSNGNKNAVASCFVNVTNSLDVSKTNGCRGGITIFPINMNNTEPITAFQFEVVLPQGVTMTGCTLSNRKEDQTVSYSKLESGNYLVTALSATNSAFSGNEGTLVNLKLAVGEDAPTGNYIVQITNIELSTATKAINPGSVSGTLSVTDVLVGDTDGNGKVSIFDAVQVVNYILGNNPDRFVETAADIDGNGRITIFDAVSIVNVILNQNE